MKSHDWFVNARYGLCVHYGLYSLLGRGEWVLNREQIPLDEYRKLAARFTAERFDAGALADLAVNAGMRYVVFTTMHHDGYRLYPTALSDFCSRRDIVGEVVAACRQRGLRIALYHSLNSWTDQPDHVAALEDPAVRQTVIRNTHERVRELVTRYNPIDVLWYDGWWPFDAQGWRSEEMNAMVRAIQPHIMFNGRNGLPGDFATPEQHLGALRPWRPWEACLTLNSSWGYHAGDHNWKTPGQVVDLLATCAQGQGNLLLNVGPRGDGSVPEPSVRLLETVGAWLKRAGAEAIFNTEMFTFNLREKGDHRGDWSSNGPMTARGRSLFQLVRRWPGPILTLAGLQAQVERATLLGSDKPLHFTQNADRVIVDGLPADPPDPVCPVIRFDCDRPPAVYLTGGMRVPRVAHPHYDPCPSDLAD